MIFHRVRKMKYKNYNKLIDNYNCLLATKTYSCITYPPQFTEQARILSSRILPFKCIKKNILKKRDYYNYTHLTLQNKKLLVINNINFSNY